MARKLAIIALSGIGLSAICLGAGIALEGKGFVGDFDGPFGRPRCQAIPGATATSRTLAWDGSDHFGLAVRSTANYAPGNDDRLRLAGDPQVLAHLKLDDGTVKMDCRGWRGRLGAITITVPGREFREFSIGGGGRLNLRNLDQDELLAEIGGSGTITASGKVDRVKIEIGGSGTSDFGRVVSRDATVEIGGSGTAHIAPTASAKIEIGGSGDVYLHSNPRDLTTEIGGSGRIHKVGS